MKRFKNILCVLESGQDYQPALQRAVTLANNNQASLTVMDVIPHITIGIGLSMGGAVLADLQAEMVQSRTKQLEKSVAPYREQLPIETKVMVGTPFLCIIREVLRFQRDLLVKMPEHHDWLDRFFASNDMRLLRKCPCPVWLLKAQAPKSYRTILAAVDVNETGDAAEMKVKHAINKQILQMAASLAIAEFAELHIAHAWEVAGESAMRHGLFTKTSQQEVDGYAEQVKQQSIANLNTILTNLTSVDNKEMLDYLKPQTHPLKGMARKEIPALAKQIDADLIVMGTVARIGIPGFIMGNTAEAIINQIDCAILAIKPDGFVTPVTLSD